MVSPSNRSLSNVTRSILHPYSIHGIWGSRKTSCYGLTNKKISPFRIRHFSFERISQFIIYRVKQVCWKARTKCRIAKLYKGTKCRIAKLYKGTKCGIAKLYKGTKCEIAKRLKGPPPPATLVSFLQQNEHDFISSIKGHSVGKLQTKTNA